MNMLLIKEKSKDNLYKIGGEEFLHITKHLKLDVGQSFVAGILNDKIGKCEILQIENDFLTCKFFQEKNPPNPAKIKLIMAIPRPKVLKRVLKHIITFGVKEIYLINSWSVEKSFIKSSIIENQEFDKIIKEALTQAKDTIYPKIEVYNLFKPFVEDILPQICDGCEKYLAHPKNAIIAPYGLQNKSIVVVGPDRGFNDFEVEQFKKQGFKTVSLGERILHQESAISYILGRFI